MTTREPRVTFSYAQSAVCGGKTRSKVTSTPRKAPLLARVVEQPAPSGKYLTGGGVCGGVGDLQLQAMKLKVFRAKRLAFVAKHTPKPPMSIEVWMVWREWIGTPTAILSKQLLLT